MKKYIILLLTGSLLLLSMNACNKKVKDQMSEVEKSLEEQKAKNEALQKELNSLNGIVVRDPILATFSTMQGSQSASTSGSYAMIYGSDYDYSYVQDQNNGSYYVYLWRGGDLGTDFGARIQFLYTPSTNTVSGAFGYAWGVLSNGDPYNVTFTSPDINVTSFNYLGQSISFTLNKTTDASFVGNLYDGVPMTMTASYSGSFKALPYSPPAQ